MTTEVKELHLQVVEALKGLKDSEAQFLGKMEGFEAAFEKVEGQVNENGKATEDAVAALKQATVDFADFGERLVAIEQKADKVASDADEEIQSIGKQFAESDSFKAFASKSASQAVMTVKTAIINATGSDQPLVQADRVAGIYDAPFRRLRVRDLFASIPTDSNMVEYVRSTFTNAANVQVGGSPQAFENVTKPESAISYALVQRPVQTLAHFIPASKQVMEDSAALAGNIDTLLMYGLKLKEETQLVSGTGSNGQLSGLTTNATAWSNESPNITNKLDIVRSAQKQLQVAEVDPDFLILNPQDWYEIEVIKVSSSENRYVVGDPRAMGPAILWGIPVVVTNSVSSGTFIMGNSMCGVIRDRDTATIEVSDQNQDNFEKNMLTIRAEERLAFCVTRAEMLVTGSL